MFISHRFVLFFIAFTSLTARFTTGADDDKDEEMEKACQAEQAIISNWTEYLAIDAAIEDIADNSTGGCLIQDGFYWCTGSLPQDDIDAYESKCTDPAQLNGTLIEIYNARITCRPPGEIQKFINIEMIPVCAGPSCGEDEVEESFMDELKTNPDVAAIDGYCIFNDGGDFPHDAAPTTAGTSFVMTFLGAIFAAVLLFT